MIWYDALTGEPVAPGEGEDGGPPSMEYYYCPECKVARELVWKLHAMICKECRLVLLVR